MKILLLAGLLAGCAAAQLTDVPPVIQIVRQPGIAAAPLRPYADAKAAIEVIGLTSMTGLPESWVIEAHPSFMSIEDLDQAMAPARQAQAAERTDSSQDDVLAPARTMIATFRGDWSYRPQEAIRMFPKARYVHVSVFHTRPGQDAGLDDLMSLRRATMDSVNLARPDLVYRVISGEPAGVYLVLAPLVSLKILDDGVAALPAYAEPIVAAEAKARTKVAEMEQAREYYLFRVEPRISYVSDEFAAGNLDFWRGRGAR